jgi:prolyl oligopeptidase
MPLPSRALLAACLPVLLGGPGCAARRARPATGSPPAGPSAATSGATAADPIAPPPTRRVEQVDDLQGHKVRDPYRWLEAVDAAEVRSWLAEQDRAARSYLEGAPARAALAARLTALWPLTRCGFPQQGGSRLVMVRAPAGHPVLVSLEPGRAERVVVDPRSTDAGAALLGHALSPDGRLLAHAIAPASSSGTAARWRVRDLASGADTGDLLEAAGDQEPAWTGDGQGFFYRRPPAGSPATAAATAVYFHRLGTPQTQDVEFASSAEPDAVPSIAVTGGGRHLVVTVHRPGTRHTRVLHASLQTPTPAGAAPAAGLREIASVWAERLRLVGGRNDELWFVTTSGAPRGKLVAIDPARPAPTHWRTLLAERDHTLLDAVPLGEQHILAHALEDGESRLDLFDRSGAQRIALPGVGFVDSLRPGGPEGVALVSYSSLATPPVVYRLALQNPALQLVATAGGTVAAEDFSVTRSAYSGRDGMRIPVLIGRRLGTGNTGRNPGYLRVGGALGELNAARFAPDLLVWMELGGVVALPAVRGGGERGRHWHQAALHGAKQNTLDDLVAAAEWLIARRYTTPAKLVVAGTEGGALAAAAVIARTPHLWSASLLRDPLADLVRLPQLGPDPRWSDELGTADDPALLPVLLGYSPYHVLEKAGAYPASLLTTRPGSSVAPVHAHKLAAALQSVDASRAPILLRSYDASGPAAELQQSIDQLAFVVRALALPAPGAPTGTATR